MANFLRWRFNPGRYINCGGFGFYHLSNTRNNRFATSQAIKNSNYRSWIYATKTYDGFIKASQSGADVVVLDLEDSIPKNLKSKMRDEYSNAIRDGLFTHNNLFVRLNSNEDYNELLKDIEYMTQKGVSGFLLSKMDNVSSLKHIEYLIARQEGIANIPTNSIQLVPIIETPSGYFSARDIAHASRRNIALQIGPADFMTYCRGSAESTTFDVLVSEISIAAGSADLMAIAGVSEFIDDYTVAEDLYSKMKKCGYSGAAVLTLSQVLLANNAFSPSPKEIHWAEMIRSRRGISTIQESIQHSRQMVGPPHQTRAANILYNKVHAPTTNHFFLHPYTPVSCIQDSISIGKVVDTPMRITISEFWKGIWESSFLTTNPYTTSTIDTLTKRANEIPFLMLNLLALAMSVSTFSEGARVHLGSYNAKQSKPVRINDTLRNRYHIESANHKFDYNNEVQYTVVNSIHQLLNQRDEIVFSVSKRTMFGPLSIENQVEISNEVFRDQNKYTDKIVEFYKESKDERTQKQRESIPNNVENPEYIDRVLNESASLKAFDSIPYLQLKPNDLIAHKDCKVYGTSETRTLCTLFKIVNDHHHNKIKHKHSEILVPGPLVIAGMLSNTERDIGTVIYEEYHCQLNINKVNYEDQLNTLSFVESCKNIPNQPDLEEVKLKHIGIKNTDIEWFQETGFPEELFKSSSMKPSDFEHICAEQCPHLYKKIACFAERKVIRLKSTC